MGCVQTADAKVDRLAKGRVYAGRRTRHLNHLSGGKRCSCKEQSFWQGGNDFLDIKTYAAKDIEAEFKKTSVLSVALAVRGNRKEKLGAIWADHEKCGMSEDGLIEAHNVHDVKYLREVNSVSLARTLHDAVFPGGAETIAATRLRSILKTQQVAENHCT
jgi:hypothetical protein